jgi:hypothetical protein
MNSEAAEGAENSENEEGEDLPRRPAERISAARAGAIGQVVLRSPLGVPLEIGFEISVLPRDRAPIH